MTDRVIERDTPAAVEVPTRRTGPKLARFRDYALVPVIGILLLAGFIASPYFLTLDNMLAVLQQSTELSLVVLAEALILLVARMDLSLESTVGLAPVIAVWLVLPAHGGRFTGLELFPGWAAIPLCLLIGALIGVINAVVVLKVRINAFIWTLGMLTTLRGLQILITGGQSVFELPESFKYLGRAAWLGVPASVWICALLFALGMVALAWSRHGRSLYAIGGNADAAKAAGIRVERVVLIVFVLGSVLAALAGILYVGRLGSIAANQGQNLIFRVFAAAVIGGISLQGGRGTLFGALTGVLALTLVDNVLTYGGAPPELELFLDGVIILGALVVSRFAAGEAQD
jgi:simple sugar transport system permease protein